MATYNNNLLLHGAKGKLGDYYIMNRGGKQIMVRRPNRDGHVAKGAQKFTQDRFRQAQQFASEICLDPGRKAFYTPFRKGGNTEYNLALGDYLKPPEFLGVDVSAYRGKTGNELLVRAMDNIRITRMLVRIEQGNGSVLEEGEAIETGRMDEWAYTVRFDHDLQAGDLVVFTAFDNAGNKAVETALLG